MEADKKNVILTQKENKTQKPEEIEEKQDKNLSNFFLFISNYIHNKKDSDIHYNEEKTNKNDIILKILDDPKTIMNDKSYLIIFIEELILQLKSGINILVPFLDIYPILVKAYIESDLDEESEEENEVEKKDVKYNEIFKLLKINSFISRENLYPIYEYFSDLYYYINEIEESDKRLKKFNKVYELLKIFYDFDIDIATINNFCNTSSFCFIGSGLKINCPKSITIDESNEFIIEINFLKIFKNIKKENLILFRTEENILIDIDFSLLEELIKENIENRISLNINCKEIILKIINDIGFELQYRFKIKTLKLFYLLENFYGQIKSIKLEHISFRTKDMKKQKNGRKTVSEKENEDKIVLFSELIEPYILTDSGPFYYNKESKISIRAIDNNLFKSNFINYLDDNFNMIEYFSGITPFVPFVPLINGIYENTKISTINGINKIEYLKRFFANFILLIIKIIEKYAKTKKDKNNNLISKFNLFFFSLIFQLNYDIICKGSHEKDGIDLSFNEIIAKLSIIGVEQSFNLFLFGKLANENINTLDNIIKNEDSLFMEKIKNDYLTENNPFVLKSSGKQLYRHIMKELFVYNRLWSKKELFYKSDNNIYNKKIKNEI
jgi:hypothetical protein